MGKHKYRRYLFNIKMKRESKEVNLVQNLCQEYVLEFIDEEDEGKR